MQIPMNKKVHELTLELRLAPRPRWAVVALVALCLALPPNAGTGENWGTTGPDGGANYHPVPSGVVTQLTVTGNSAQAAWPGNPVTEIGYQPTVVLGRGGTGTDSLNPQTVVLNPGGAFFTGIGFPAAGTTVPTQHLHVRGHVKVAQCIWIGSSARCAGDWQ
ncbi:MAG: hypothetical protein HY553_17875 [Elusimicrobia bacterium]|nr:hypothetical protein [Elusimicrobiota bacterium]